MNLKVQTISAKPMLSNFTPRLYQEAIFNTATMKNTLVVLPTGLGKTAIAMMMTSHRLATHPASKILFLAPTKPLVEQHKKSYEEHLTLDMALFTGEVRPAQRELLWNQAKIIFSTPQSIENDVINEKITLEDVSLIIFDEAHRAVGEYSYPFLARQYMRQAKHPRILALTASPGSDTEKVNEICQNLFIEAVEVRTDQDPDVAPYIQDVEFNIIHVTLPPQLLQAKNNVDLCIKTKLKSLEKYGGKIAYYSKKELLKMQRTIQARLAQGEKSFLMLKCMSVLAEIIKAQHALELIETQGVSASLQYFERMYQEYPTTKTKAVKNLCEDAHFKTAYHKLKQLNKDNQEHPKMAALRKEVAREFNNDKYAKIILFTQYRDTAVQIKKTIEHVPGAIPEIFVGQAKKQGTGLSQKEQREMLDQFRDGMFNVLIATSVAEEGLDIPKVDSVIFYEPIPSAIRTIQRRGRTGRQAKGRVTLLITKGTRDEGYHWSAKGKEKRMQKTLKTMKNVQPKQPTLKEYTKSGILIHADHREKGSAVIKSLIEEGVSVRLEQLQQGDFVISNKVGVEYKTAEDFVNSIIDGRLLTQLRALHRFDKPLLIIEGEDYYNIRGVHPNAIRGMLATITVSFGIPVLQTKHAKETSKLLIAIAKREQTTENKEHIPHPHKVRNNIQGQQEYLVSALPNIGGKTAKDLLQKFGTPRNIFKATEQEWQNVEGIGKKIAEQIKKVMDDAYNG